jgi:hypothetical protein
MSVDLPFLKELDIEMLMKVRQEEGEAFQSFRLELDKQLRELRLVKDPEALKIKTENVMHELSEVQVTRSIKNSSPKEAVLHGGYDRRCKFNGSHPVR